MRVIALHMKIAKCKSWNAGPLRGPIRMPSTVAGKRQKSSHYRKLLFSTYITYYILEVLRITQNVWQ